MSGIWATTQGRRGHQPSGQGRGGHWGLDHVVGNTDINASFGPIPDTEWMPPQGPGSQGLARDDRSETCSGGGVTLGSGWSDR
jgi:hypothetical protein